MSEPTIPVFVIDGLDVAIVRSWEQAHHDLEPWLNDDAQVVMLDSVGRSVRLRFEGQTVIGGLAESPPHPEILRDHLAHALEAAGASAPQHLPLAELVSLAVTVLG